MAKFYLKAEAKRLREQGTSIGQISKMLGIAKSTTSVWVSEVPLTPEQILKLKSIENIGKALGRLKTIAIHKEKRKRRIEYYKNLAIQTIPNMTKQELLIAGLALYWAEGTKNGRSRRVEFCNSDPVMIKFFTHWLNICFDIEISSLKAVVGINQVHLKRDQKVREYWSTISAIPLSQFRKTSFKKVQSKKVYDNFEEHYGTLTILVTKSTSLYYRLMGLISNLYPASIA